MTISWRGSYALLVKVLGISYILYHVLSAKFLLLPGLGSMFIHVNGALLLAVMTVPLRRGQPWRPWLDIPVSLVLAGLTISSGVYIFLMSPELMAGGIGGNYPAGVLFGVLTVLVVLEANRRVLGWSLSLIVLGCLLYARFGEDLPTLFAHVNFDVVRIMNLIYLGTDGLYGMIARVSFSYIALFIIYAEFLRTSGGGDFFVEIAYSLAGRIRGGPAKVAVVASCLFGSISGSAVANVAGTGVMTIPLMKRTGYAPHYAAAIEAAASTGGQFMPPIMGASAFLVADFVGVDYIRVAAAAFIPALIYYLALFVTIDIRAVKKGLSGLPPETLPKPGPVLRKGWHHLISPAVLVYLMAVPQWTPTRAAFWSIVMILAVALVRREKNFLSGVLLPSLENSVQGIVMMGAVAGALGIIVGIFGLTGLSLKLSTILIDLAGGNLVVLLILAMLTSLFFGMGLPTVAAYVLLAILVAPALENIGVPLLAGHLFCLFFGILSVITPPVCLASYTAAMIAQSGPMKTGFTALRLSLPGFLLPYVFVFSPSLLLIHPGPAMLLPLFTCLLGVCALAVSLEGYLYGPLSIVNRALILLGAIAVIAPEVWTDMIGLALLVLGAGPTLWRHWSLRARPELVT